MKRTAAFFILILKLITAENIVKKNLTSPASDKYILPEKWVVHHSFSGSVDSPLSDLGNIRRGLVQPKKFEPLEQDWRKENKTGSISKTDRVDENMPVQYDETITQIEPPNWNSENILMNNESVLLINLQNYTNDVTGSEDHFAGSDFISYSNTESFPNASLSISQTNFISKRILHLDDHNFPSTPVAMNFQLRQPLLERATSIGNTMISHDNKSLSEEFFISDVEALDLLVSLSNHNINMDNCPVTELSESACSDLTFLSNIYKKPALEVDKNISVQYLIRNPEVNFFYSSASLNDLWQNHINFDGHLNLEIVDTTYEQLVDYYQAPIDQDFVLPKMSVMDNTRIKTVNRGPLPYEYDNEYNFYSTQRNDKMHSKMELPSYDHLPIVSVNKNLNYDNIGPRIVLHAPLEFPTDALVEAMSLALPNAYQKASERIDDSTNFPNNMNYPFKIQTPISTQEQLPAPQSSLSLQATTPSLLRLRDDSDINVRDDLSSSGKTRFVIRLRKPKDEFDEEDTGSVSSSIGNDSDVTEVKLKNGKRFRVRIKRKKNEEQQEFSESKKNPIQIKKIPTMKASGSFTKPRNGYPPAKSPGYPPAKSPGYPPAKSPGYPMKSPGNLKPSFNLGSLKNKIPGFMGELDGLFGNLGSIFSKNMNDAYSSTNGFLQNIFGGVNTDVYYENILTLVAIASFLAFVYLRGLSMINTLAALNYGKTDNLLAVVKKEDYSELSSILTSIQDRIGKWTGLEKSKAQQSKKKQGMLDTTKLLKKALNVSDDYEEEYYVDEENYVKQIDDTARIGAILIDAALELKVSGDNANDASCLARPLCELNKKSSFFNGIQKLIVPILSTFVQWMVVSPSDIFSSLEVLRPLWLSEGSSSESCSRILACSNNMTARLFSDLINPFGSNS